MMEPVRRSSYETLVACPQCLGAVNASLEVERGVLDVLTRLALSKAWDGIDAPALERVVTRLVQDYEERVQLRILQDPIDPPLRPPKSPARGDRARKRARAARSSPGTKREETA